MMKTTKTKWDKSIALRCLAICSDTAEQTETEVFEAERKTADDIMWEDFKNALDKVLKK